MKKIQNNLVQTGYFFTEGVGEYKNFIKKFAQSGYFFTGKVEGG